MVARVTKDWYYNLHTPLASLLARLLSLAKLNPTTMYMYKFIYKINYQLLSKP